MTFGKMVLIVALALLVFLGVGLLAEYAGAQAPSFDIEWTAPGDDGTVGTATRYEMRYRTVPVSGVDTLSWWNAANVVANMPTPVVAGTRQSVTIPAGLSYNTTYYFILRTWDDGLPAFGPTPIPNVSAFSNVGTKVMGPPPDLIPPAAVRDLIAR